MGEENFTRGGDISLLHSPQLSGSSSQGFSIFVSRMLSLCRFSMVGLL